jgi:glycine/D-amino acid oxidase-like deaminating enzyme
VTRPTGSDVVVVGGGVVGGAVALGLADAGVAVTLVSPRAAAGRQASRAAGGMLGVFSEVSSHDPPDRRDIEVGERWRARGLYDAWLVRLADGSGLAPVVRPGLFVVANIEGEDDEREIAAIADAASGCGCTAHAVPWRDVPGLAPARRSTPLSVLHLPDEGHVDAALVMDALDATLAAHPRVDVVDGRAAALVPAGDDGLTVRLGGGREWRASQVVVAGGAESTDLLANSEGIDAGLPPILAGRGVSLVVRATTDLPVSLRTPNRGFACGLHLVPRTGGLTYLGATNRLTTGPIGSAAPTVDELCTLLDGAVRELNTNLRHAEVISSQVGYRPLTLDRLPLVGRSADPRVLVASGTYRNGLLLAPAVAEHLVGEVLAPGSGAQHPFSPVREAKVALGPEVAGRAGRSIVAQLIGSAAGLAPGRAVELEEFLSLALEGLLDDRPIDDRLRRKLARLLERAPVEEAIPLVFEAAVRHHSDTRSRP